jgi:hypothetical protein
LLLGHAAPWQLGTNSLARFKRSHGKIARLYVEEASALYPSLENWVDDRNTASKRLLEWLGFTLEEPTPFGVEGLPFRKFWRRA